MKNTTTCILSGAFYNTVSFRAGIKLLVQFCNFLRKLIFKHLSVILEGTLQIIFCCVLFAVGLETAVRPGFILHSYRILREWSSHEEWRKVSFSQAFH